MEKSFEFGKNKCFIFKYAALFLNVIQRSLFWGVEDQI